MMATPINMEGIHMKLTPEEKKQREILKWEKEKNRAKAPGYMIYFLLIVCVVYVCDEVAS